jgi:hypothetical protein
MSDIEVLGFSLTGLFAVAPFIVFLAAIIWKIASSNKAETLDKK